MPHSEDYKEVLFDQYCPTCEHEPKKETEDPCCHCLDEPTNLYSHKPVNYEPSESEVK